MEKYDVSTTIELDMGGDETQTIIRRRIALYRDFYDMLFEQVQKGNVDAIPSKRCVMLMYNFYEDRGLLELYNGDITERKLKKCIFKCNEWANFNGDNVHAVKEENSDRIVAFKLELDTDGDLVRRRNRDANKRINGYEANEKKRMEVSMKNNLLPEGNLKMVLKFPELFSNKEE